MNFSQPARLPWALKGLSSAAEPPKTLCCIVNVEKYLCCCCYKVKCRIHHHRITSHRHAVCSIGLTYNILVYIFVFSDLLLFSFSRLYAYACLSSFITNLLVAVFYFCLRALCLFFSLTTNIPRLLCT